MLMTKRKKITIEYHEATRSQLYLQLATDDKKEELVQKMLDPNYMTNPNEQNH